ncbi:hypothetical protein GCM10009865_51280 [Aeromicrobium ponti]
MLVWGERGAYAFLGGGAVGKETPMDGYCWTGFTQLCHTSFFAF